MPEEIDWSTITVDMIAPKLNKIVNENIMLKERNEDLLEFIDEIRLYSDNPVVKAMTTAVLKSLREANSV